MNIDLILYVVTFIFFLLCGFNVPASRVNWQCLGFAALVLSLIV